MAALLGLAAAVGYGGADFLGGLLSRRGGALPVVVCSQLAGLGLLLVAVAPFGASVPTAAALGWGSVAGAAVAFGLVIYYRGLARARMGVVAPIAAVVTAGLPVVAGLGGGERPSLFALAGVALAVAAVVLVSLTPAAAVGAAGHAGSPGPVAPAPAPPGPALAPPGPALAPPAPDDLAAQRAASGRRLLGPLHHLREAAPPGVVEALASGVAFAVFFIAMDRTGAGAAVWPLLAANLASLLVLVTAATATRRAWRPVPGSWPGIVLTGLLGTGASLAFLLAVREGLLSLVSVLASLSPAVTVALARMFAGERLTRLQLTGLVTALAGVALITLG